MRQLAGHSGAVQLQAWDALEQRAVMSPLTYWFHADGEKVADYLRITTESGGSLRLRAVGATSLRAGLCA